MELRGLSRATLLMAILTFGLFAPGCGDEDQARSGDAFGEGDANLTVTLDSDGPEGPKEEMTEEVSCDEVGKSDVCTEIRDLEPSDFDPIPGDQACTELFGGPDVATIEGQLDGEEVDAELTRSNGCEIARFDNALPLLRELFEGYEPGASLGP